MLRIGLCASAIPLTLLGLLARGPFAPGAGPCIALGDTSLQIIASHWKAHLRVAFTNDPALANVRVQIVDSAETADFALVDDLSGTAADAGIVTRSTRTLALSDAAPVAGPLIYLSHEDQADYRIFVSSIRYSTRDAAALVVSAGGNHARISTAALRG